MIAIVDYGLGNVGAFANVYKRLNIPCCVAKTPDELGKANKIILPGVGAFDHAMCLLNGSGMREALDEAVQGRNLLVLGVCVGMQMMAHTSEEGQLPGLGWIDGEVRKLEVSRIRIRTRLPHMGWNNVIPIKADKIFEKLGDSPIFYFLHSFGFVFSSEESILAVTEYGDRFPSAVRSRNVYGIQCHPEKSHHNGVQLLANFAAL